jgi:hypothetical protein
MVLGPVFHVLTPGFDLMAAGFTGGAAAYLLHRLTRRKAKVGEGTP